MIEVVDQTDQPWMNRPRCGLPGYLVRELLDSDEKPCSGCNQSRAKCGGLPSADGDPRP